MVNPPTANLNQLASTCESTSPLSIKRMSSAPTMAPKTVPIPPVRAVPPITAAATACSSSPSPIDGSGEPSRKTWIVPANPASIEQITKQIILTRQTGTPNAAAASIKPPVAWIQLPKFEPLSMTQAMSAITANQMKDALRTPAGPTNWVNTPMGNSLDSRGGKPPVKTTVSERTMKSIPNVVIKLGMLNVNVRKPFTKPTTAAIPNPSNIASMNGTPELVIKAMHTGIKANVEPTDKSNSPQIISMATPMVTRPASGSRPSIPRKLPGER